MNRGSLYTAIHTLYFCAGLVEIDFKFASMESEHVEKKINNEAAHVVAPI